MGFRKIIGFGGSSFVVSLPKDWIVRNGLKKGDTIAVDEDGNSVKISHIFPKQSNNDKEITIDFDGNIKKLKSELIYAYIDNYNLINITGKNLFNNIEDIKNILDGLVALEVIQKSPQKIVLKDFLNVQDISIHDTLRRIDRIVLSMSEDIRYYLSGKNNKVISIIEQKENDLNRLSNLIFKTLKKSFNPNDRAILKLDFGDIFYYWEMTLFIEKIGDQLKLLPRHIKPNVNQECIKIFDLAMLQYTDSMKANFTHNYSLAITVLTNRKQIYNDAEKLLIKLPVGQGYSATMEKVKNINDYAGNIAKSLLRLKLTHNKS